MASLTVVLFMSDKLLTGTYTVSKKLSYYQEPKCDNPERSILLLKPWNYITVAVYRTLNFSGGAPFSATCACVYNQEMMCPLI